MENKESQILSEIMEMMASIRSQLELLDAKMALPIMKHVFSLRSKTSQDSLSLLPDLLLEVLGNKNKARKGNKINRTESLTLPRVKETFY